MTDKPAKPAASQGKTTQNAKRAPQAAAPSDSKAPIAASTPADKAAPARATAKATREKAAPKATPVKAVPKPKAAPAKPTAEKPVATKAAKAKAAPVMPAAPSAGTPASPSAPRARKAASPRPVPPHREPVARAGARAATAATKPAHVTATPTVQPGSAPAAAELPIAAPVARETAAQNAAPSASIPNAESADAPAAPAVEQPAPSPETQPVSSAISAEPAVESALGLSSESTPPAEADGAEEPDLDALRIRLMALQQQVRAAGIPVVIVVDGWNASGKGTMVSKLIEGLDPRGYQVYPIRKPTAEERAYPPMRRYWVRMPAQGGISVFCGSWYREASTACFESKAARKRLNHTYDEIVNLESQLWADGTLLIKFFLHIPRKEQKARLKELESKKATRWRVEKEDWEQNEHYEEYLRLYDAMIARTQFEGAAWHVLRSDNRGVCIQQIYETVIAAFEAALTERAAGKRDWDTPYLQHLEVITPLPMPALETIDPEQALADPYKPAVDKAQKHLSRLQNELYRRGIPMVVGFEGWDAAGKGGAIRRLTSSLDARGFDVVPISAPTPLEKSHHHLWRFWDSVPMDGNIAIFDRTWYGRVLVERVEGYCTPSQWKRAYEEINRFEAALAAHGTVLVKFWLHIDPQTQLTRFTDRETTPEKQWKITPDDWRNREKWPQYAAAVDEMLQKTNTAAAPWTVVEANNKQFARLKVLHTVIQAIEARLKEEEE